VEALAGQTRGAIRVVLDFLSADRQVWLLFYQEKSDKQQLQVNSTLKHMFYKLTLQQKIQHFKSYLCLRIHH